MDIESIEPLLTGRAQLAGAHLAHGAAAIELADRAIALFRAVLDGNPADPRRAEALHCHAEALTEKARWSAVVDAEPLYSEAERQFAEIANPPAEVLLSWGRTLLAHARGGAA